MIRSLLALLLCLAALPAAAQSTLEYMDSGQWSFNEDCAVRGDTVVTVMSYGVQLWDAADPAATTMIGDFYMEANRGRAVAWEGDLVAATSKLGHLYLLDVGDPAQPQLIDRLSGLGSSPDVALRRAGSTRWCYSAGNAANDFQIRDLTNPAAAVSRGAINLDGTPNALAVLGDLVLVCARSFGLYALDVGDPDAPTILDTVPLPGTHLNVAASGTRAAIASNTDGFTLFDIGDPQNIVTHATVSPAAGEWSDLWVQEVLLEGSTLYAICADVGVLVYDISDLDSPVLTGYDARLDIVNGTPPYYFFNSGQLSGDRVYVTHWSGFVPGCDIMDATSSTVDYLGRTAGFDYVRDVDEDGGFVYGCTGQMGIFAHEHVAENEFVPRGQLHVVETWGVKAIGSLVYVASTTDGLVIGDFTDPDQPLRRGELDVGQARQLEVIGDVAYVGAFTQGFHTVDVSDPDDPVGLDVVTRPNMETVNVSVVGGLAATADHGDGMNLWDVSDPADIRHLANYPTAANAVDVVIEPSGRYAYLTVVGEGIHVIDVEAPGSPVHLNTFETAATGAALQDGYIHVTTGSAGISTYDMWNDPVHPVEIASFNTCHSAWGAATGVNFGRYHVYVADYAGIAVLRFTPDTPVAVSSFRLAWDGGRVSLDWRLAEDLPLADQRLTVSGKDGGEIALAILPVGAQAFAAEDTRAELAAGGLWLYRLYGREPGGDWQLLRSEQIATQAAPAAALHLRAFPNPFNPQTTLSFTLPAAGSAELEIYDASGRRVRLLHDGWLAAGPAAFEWDGLDRDGRELAGGVYFARLGTASGSRSAKLVMLR